MTDPSGWIPPCRDRLLLVAEIGANHDGDPAKAHLLIDAFSAAGAAAVKFQTYTASQLVADPDRLYAYGPPDRRRTEPIGKMFDRLALPREAHADLFAHARERGMEPFTTLFDPADVEFALRLGQRIFKVSSADVTYRNLLVEISRSGLPAIVSGGKCTLDELRRAVEVLTGGGGTVSVLHCVSGYPTPMEEANLRTLELYRREFPDAPLGFSDHTQGSVCALGAVALGASLIEKHVTYDRGAEGPDHWFSMDAAGFKDLATQTRDLFEGLGRAEKRIAPSEEYGMRFGRRSIVASRDLPAGHVLDEGDLLYLRPGTGLDPFRVGEVLGRRCRFDIPARTLIREEMLAPR